MAPAADAGETEASCCWGREAAGIGVPLSVGSIVPEDEAAADAVPFVGLPCGDDESIGRLFIGTTRFVFAIDCAAAK